MRITVIVDREGKIRALASCQMHHDNAVGELEITARLLPMDASSVGQPGEAEELESHIVELPHTLAEKGLEEIQKLAYLDLKGDRPMLCLNKKTNKR